MENLKEKLFTDFPAISTEEWVAKITADLKGADFAKRLVWKTNEGFSVNPFYRSEDLEGLCTPDALPGEFPFVRGTKKDNNWLVRQDIAVKGDAKAANAKALDVLYKGVNSLGFRFKGSDVSADFVATLLKDIAPDAVELNFTTCHTQVVNFIEIFTNYLKSSGVDLSKVRGSVNYDPFKSILKRGADNPDWVADAQKVLQAAEQLPNVRVLNVNANMFSNAGSYIYQELGYALADGNEILAKLTEAGADASAVAKKIKFNFGIGTNFFMEVAKFRAARWLWAQIVNAYGADHEAAKINSHAETTTFNMTVFDAHVNMLRTQTEAMSATIGNVDSLTVLPFDVTYQESDEFAERIARNQQLLLKDECHFDRTTDPSAGSYYVENLTNSIAEQAWALFLQTDEKGFYAALKAGEVQSAIQASADARFKAVATRREILLGTNQYPNFTETAGNKIVKDTFSECGCSKGDLLALPTTRLATDFEQLRLATERTKTPKVFMLTIGNLAMRLARSQFSCNFFACAGYQVIDNLGFDTVQAGVDAAVAKGANIIVLCSSDDEYATYAPEAYKLAEANNKLFVVAGAPACADELKAQGIEYFINVKSNVLETLKVFSKKLGIN